MPADNEKTQIGIRLPAELVRLIDYRRQNRTRAEYCRELIESGLAAPEHQVDGPPEAFSQAVQSLQEQLSEVRQASILTEREAGEIRAEIRKLRVDLATVTTGVLTKIGQVVREEDQRKFAREKAEAFVKRVLLKHLGNQEEEP